MSEMTSHHWTSDPDKLEAFVLHRINEQDEIKLSAHLKQCDECRQRVQEERELISGIRRFGRSAMKRRIKLRLRHEQSRRIEWAQVASIAAAVVIMLGAVFTIRYFVDFGQNKTHSHEIALKKSESSHRALWIIGKVIVQARIFRGTLSERSSSFMIKQGTTTQNVSIRHVGFAELPPTMKNTDESIVQTFLERTSNGLQLTLYVDSTNGSLATGIETVSADSLIVYFRGQQIAYHIPGGWAGKI
jgi:hypothetical protein